MKRIAAGLALVLGGVAAWQAITAFGRPGEFEVGLDLRIIVWAPVHGLFAGFDPYAPTGT